MLSPCLEFSTLGKILGVGAMARWPAPPPTVVFTVLASLCPNGQWNGDGRRLIHQEWWRKGFEIPFFESSCINKWVKHQNELQLSCLLAGYRSILRARTYNASSDSEAPWCKMGPIRKVVFYMDRTGKHDIHIFMDSAGSDATQRR